MIRIIQTLLAIQICLFAFAASAHLGLFGGRNDPAAASFETLIAVVLSAALVTSFVRPWFALVAARAAQGFALILTLVGFTLVLTVGPTTAFDVTMHLVMLTLLGIGLVITVRGSSLRGGDGGERLGAPGPAR